MRGAVSIIKEWVIGCFDALFPHCCVACGVRLDCRNEYLCQNCLSSLPITNHWFMWSNQLSIQLQPLAKFSAAIALIPYTKSNKYYNIFHFFKFRNQKMLAYHIGRLFAMYIEHSPLIDGIEALVPLPLHPKRLQWRGYNQSEYIARGIASVLNVEVITDAVIRTKNNKSQASTKSPAIRRENLKDSFKVISKAALKGKKVALVDDIITTGATISSCAGEICKSVKNIELIALCIGYTEPKKIIR